MHVWAYFLSLISGKSLPEDWTSDQETQIPHKDSLVMADVAVTQYFVDLIWLTFSCGSTHSLRWDPEAEEAAVGLACGIENMALNKTAYLQSHLR